MTKDIHKERQRLEAELPKLKCRAERRRQEADRDQKRHTQIHDALLRLRCLELLAVAGGVMLRYRQPTESRWSKLNDVAGTLVEVRRTCATVDFGELGQVTVRLDNLLPTAERRNQGFVLSFGRASR